MIDRVYPLEPSGARRARDRTHYRFADGKGEIGFVNPVSEPFCADCNRIRLTAEGKLRTCLFSLHETDLREPLRSGAGDAELEKLIRDAVWRKELKHQRLRAGIPPAAAHHEPDRRLRMARGQRAPSPPRAGNLEGGGDGRPWLRCYRCWSQNLEAQVHYDAILRIDPDSGRLLERVDEVQEAVVQCLDCMHDQPHLTFTDGRIEPIEDRWERMVTGTPWVASCTVTVDQDLVEVCSGPEAADSLTYGAFGEGGTREFFTTCASTSTTRTRSRSTCWWSSTRARPRRPPRCSRRPRAACSRSPRSPRRAARRRPSRASRTSS